MRIDQGSSSLTGSRISSCCSACFVVKKNLTKLWQKFSHKRSTWPQLTTATRRHRIASLAEASSKGLCKSGTRAAELPIYIRWKFALGTSEKRRCRDKSWKAVDWPHGLRLKFGWRPNKNNLPPATRSKMKPPENRFQETFLNWVFPCMERPQTPAAS